MHSAILGGYLQFGLLTDEMLLLCVDFHFSPVEQTSEETSDQMPSLIRGVCCNFCYLLKCMILVNVIHRSALCLVNENTASIPAGLLHQIHSLCFEIN